MRLREGFYIALSCGFFIALFLIIYQPFGTYEFSSDSKYLFLSGYGFIVFSVMLLFWSGIRFWIKPASLNAHWVAIATVIISFIVALVIAFFYKQWYFQSGINLSTLLGYLPFGLATGLIPIAIVIWFKLRQHKIQSSKQSVVFIDNNGKGILKVALSDVLFIKASDNYIEVHYLKHTDVECKLLRNTLSMAQNQLSRYSQFVRCHRSYLVNLERVKKTSGNKDRLVLSLHDDAEIPVSRQHAETILQQLTQN